jgi:hypothetical protein
LYDSDFESSGVELDVDAFVNVEEEEQSQVQMT